MNPPVGSRLLGKMGAMVQVSNELHAHLVLTFAKVLAEELPNWKASNILKLAEIAIDTSLTETRRANWREKWKKQSDVRARTRRRPRR